MTERDNANRDGWAHYGPFPLNFEPCVLYSQDKDELFKQTGTVPRIRGQWDLSVCGPPEKLMDGWRAAATKLRANKEWHDSNPWYAERQRAENNAQRTRKRAAPPHKSQEELRNERFSRHNNPEQRSQSRRRNEEDTASSNTNRSDRAEQACQQWGQWGWHQWGLWHQQQAQVQRNHSQLQQVHNQWSHYQQQQPQVQLNQSQLQQVHMQWSHYHQQQAQVQGGHWQQQQAQQTSQSKASPRDHATAAAAEPMEIATAEPDQTSKPKESATAKPVGTASAKPADSDPTANAAAQSSKPEGSATAKPIGTASAKPADSDTKANAAAQSSKPKGSATGKPVGAASAKPANSDTKANATAQSSKPQGNATGKPVGTAAAKQADSNTKANATATPRQDIKIEQEATSSGSDSSSSNGSGSSSSKGEGAKAETSVLGSVTAKPASSPAPAEIATAKEQCNQEAMATHGRTQRANRAARGRSPAPARVRSQSAARSSTLQGRSTSPSRGDALNIVKVFTAGYDKLHLLTTLVSNDDGLAFGSFLVVQRRIVEAMLPKRSRASDPTLCLDISGLNLDDIEPAHCGQHWLKIKAMLEWPELKLRDHVRRVEEFVVANSGANGYTNIVLIDKTGDNQAVTLASILSPYLQARGYRAMETTHLHLDWRCSGSCECCEREPSEGQVKKYIDRAVKALAWGN